MSRVGNQSFEEQQTLDSKSQKNIHNRGANKQGLKSIYQYSQALRKKETKRFSFNQQSIKNIAQKLINSSYILQKKFQNHQLLDEEYLNDYSFKFKGIDKIQKKFPIISFNNKGILIWEMVKQIIYLFFMWMLPFSNSFLPNQNIQLVEIILFTFLIIDNFLQLNQETIVKGQLISDRRQLVQNYINNRLIFQLIYMFFYSCITFQFLEQDLTQIFNLIFFFLNLKKFQQFIQNYRNNIVIINDKINLIELIITVLLTHFMAYLWFYVGTISQQYYTESWILKLNLQNESILTQYCYSFYWAAATMVTVGYGDITGQNLYEIICSTILLFFSSGIFAFSINSIGMILNNINQNGQQYRRNLLLINQYMDQNNVSGDLQVKVRNYLQFYYQSSLSNHQKDVNTILDQLSQNLKSDLISDVRQKIIQKNQFLQNNFSSDTSLQIIHRSQSIDFIPLEQIYEQECKKDHSLYIILKGAVNLIDKNSGRIVQKCQQEDRFGELEFLTEQPRYLTAYSSGYTQILKINRNDFIQIIKQKINKILNNIISQRIKFYFILYFNVIKYSIDLILKRSLNKIYFTLIRKDKHLIEVNRKIYINYLIISWKYKDYGKSNNNISTVNLNLGDSELNIQQNKYSRFFKTAITQHQSFQNKFIFSSRLEQEDDQIQVQEIQQNNYKMASIKINSNGLVLTSSAQLKQKAKFQNSTLRDSVYDKQIKSPKQLQIFQTKTICTK